MCGQVERSPLVNSSCHVQIENLHAVVLKLAIELHNSPHALLLPLTDGCMQGRPIIYIFYVDLSPVHYQSLRYILTLLRILRE